MISKFSNLDINVLICSNASIGAPELFSKSLIKKIRAETLKSHKFLKIKKLFLDLPAPKLDQYPIYKISNMIQKLLLKINMIQFLCRIILIYMLIIRLFHIAQL